MSWIDFNSVPGIFTQNGPAFLVPMLNFDIHLAQRGTHASRITDLEDRGLIFRQVGNVSRHGSHATIQSLMKKLTW